MADQADIFIPEPTFPAAENALTQEVYGNAGVILEYGSGASTLMAAELGAQVFSVESDADWARNMEAVIRQRGHSERVYLHYCDIGPTKKWGRPVDESGWRQYHTYPLSIWDHAGFSHPDAVMIDGRFRVGCLLAALFLIKKPTIALFDDYAGRPRYAAVERFVKPSRIVGRMAVFELQPKPFDPAELSDIITLFQRTM